MLARLIKNSKFSLLIQYETIQGYHSQTNPQKNQQTNEDF